MNKSLQKENAFENAFASIELVLSRQAIEIKRKRKKKKKGLNIVKE